MFDQAAPLLEPMAACREWAAQHLATVLAAREAYEERAEPSGPERSGSGLSGSGSA